ncbi:MAG: radical SAM protein [Magnetococcales bacterium]|nr:radical SAM protein [Magnetococcales bacterium]
MNDFYGLDSHKMIYHPRRAADVLEANGVWEKGRSIYPIYVEISPIGACNHRCLFCAIDYVGYHPDRLQLAVMRQRLPEMARLGVKSVHFAGEGEPMLHKEIAPMIHAAKTGGLDAALTTNASVLPHDFIDVALPSLSWVKVSINAGTAATYAAIHRPSRKDDFDRVLDHMRAMVEAKRRHRLTCVLGAQALLLPDNASEMETLALLCREIGMDYLVIKPYSQHLSSNNKSYESIDYGQFIGLGERLQALETDRFALIFRERTMRKTLDTTHRYDKCYATPFLWAYIMATGVVSGCSAYLLDPRFEYGNINQQTFAQIWEGERRREGMRFVAQQLDIKDCRLNCRMDDINRYLHAIHTGSPPHMNFI